jgi:hypothetical protein
MTSQRATRCMQNDLKTTILALRNHQYLEYLEEGGEPKKRTLQS